MRRKARSPPAAPPIEPERREAEKPAPDEPARAVGAYGDRLGLLRGLRLVEADDNAAVERERHKVTS